MLTIPGTSMHVWEPLMQDLRASTLLVGVLESVSKMVEGLAMPSIGISCMIACYNVAMKGIGGMMNVQIRRRMIFL